MLDDDNVLQQRDSGGTLQIAEHQYEQAKYEFTVQPGSSNNQPINRVIIAGMGGSVLAPLLIKTWLEQDSQVPIEIVNGYILPGYVDSSTLVIVDSHSGNTEETVNILQTAIEKSAQTAVTTTGGKALEIAKANQLCYVELPFDSAARLAFIFDFKALVSLLIHFNIIPQAKLDEVTDTATWLGEESASWQASSTVDKNYAKQLALLAEGKAAIFYAGHLSAPVAYKWKISWNETAKNIAFKSEYPEFNHNEIMSWLSHPIEKPFAIFDIVSSLEHPQILKRFEISDRLLSGYRPKTITINLKGDTLLKQLFWGGILADFSSIYLAILNGVNPNNTDLIEKLKQQL
jgi:glucose/mannose-6-phosphate isomerase